GGAGRGDAPYRALLRATRAPTHAAWDGARTALYPGAPATTHAHPQTAGNWRAVGRDCGATRWGARDTAEHPCCTPRAQQLDALRARRRGGTARAHRCDERPAVATGASRRGHPTRLRTAGRPIPL